MKRFIVTGFVLLAVFSLLVPLAEAGKGELTGEEILLKMDKTMRAAGQKYMIEKMVLTSSSGSVRSRTVNIWNKNLDGDNKMMVKFLSPANIAGTGVLMIDDDMWLYLPALGKVKRIAGSARQGSFMGSDLSYEDMEAMGNTGFSPDYRAELQGETLYNDREAFQLKLTPETEGGSYSRLEILVDSERYLPLEIIYYGEDGVEKKVLKTSDHQKIDGYWTAGELVVQDLARGSKTALLVEEVDFVREINEAVFTTRYLERGN